MAANQGTKIAWDSNVVIDCLQKKAGRYEWIRPLVLKAESDKLLIVVSTLAIAEVFRIDGHPVDKEMHIIEEFFDRSWVYAESAGTGLSKIARDVRRKFSVGGIDSIHVATAIFTNCSVFLTNDGVTKKKTPILPLDNQIAIGDRPPLRIMTPEAYHAQQDAEENPLLAIVPNEVKGDLAAEIKDLPE